ncbi:MAG: di-trans,poly-cis-decaprenylcistransferase [Puniceicoccales bacterium]|jgi:undecaprenyl diphosphate synthase|nr:di-trans,poly-cis-decaprenylcistransferase [Puniceicoccales bacterium]
MFYLGPMHIAVVMDGNRRWAKKNNFPLFYGHRRGVHAVSEVTKTALDRGISHLTFFAFSTENWKRSGGEISYLMRLFSRSIDRYETFLLREGICVRFIGDLAPLDPDLLGKISSIQEQTQRNEKLFLTIAINYGSRDEVVRAVKKMSINELQNCSWETFRRHLDSADLPDVDLFIRTSGEQRLSNFLLLQSAYAELIFVQKNWPEFTGEDFGDVLQEFGQRKRNFGK